MRESRTNPYCIDEGMLADFNTGRISDPLVESRIAEHLSSCDRCDARLRQLPADSIVALLQAPDPLDSLAASGDSQLLFTVTKSLAVRESSETPVYRAVPPAPAPLPVRIDRYFIVRHLGGGGFADVYLAKDPEQNRLVAIKAPRRDRLSDPETREQFLREARTVAALEHDHIVPMYDCRELADGQCIVVMRYVEGETLRAAIAQGPLDARRAADTIARVADALHYAHVRRIWHRDVKPANILLDGQGTPYLADFGLAIHEHQFAAEEYSLAGTYPYMSPEQLYEHPTRLDGRTDIWSLGVVLYESLTGRRPFQGATLEAISDEVRRREPRPLPTGPSGVPEELARICHKCLAKKRDDRYETAAELAADLRRFLAPSPARRPKRRWVAISSLVAGLAVIGAVFGMAKLFDKPGNGISGNGPSAPQPIAAGTPPTGTPEGERAEGSGTRAVQRRLLTHAPREDLWTHLGNNHYDVDEAQERLTAKHASARAFLSFGTTEATDFRARFVATIDEWHGKAGFYWGMQEEREAFPEKMHRCLGVTVAKHEPSGELKVSVERYDFVPSPVDNSKLHCSNAHQIAEARTELPAQPAIAVEILVERGQLVEVRVNQRPVELTWTPSRVEWGRVGPTGFGFLVFDGVVIVENASLDELESEHGEER
jgi:hypothetical protein